MISSILIMLLIFFAGYFKNISCKGVVTVAYSPNFAAKSQNFPSKSSKNSQIILLNGMCGIS
jgi:hypothetical protein